MKKLISLLFYSFLFFLPSLSYCQSNFRPGYIVSLKGDTLHGFVNYKEWDNNPESIAFKKELTQSDPEIFTSQTVKAFGITGQLYYESFAVSVSQDVVNVTSLEFKLDTNYKNDIVFLRVLNRGKYMTLYSYKDNIKQRFYILETVQTSPYELIYHAYYNESSVVQYVKRFHTQLENIVQKNGIRNDKMDREILQSDYSETDITRIVQKVNGNSSKQFNAPNLSGTRWFAGASFNNSKFQFTGNYELANAPASNSISPKLDAGFDFFLNKNIQKFYLRLEAAFTYGQYSFNYYNPESTPVGRTSLLNFKMFNTALIPQCVYNVYNKEKLKVFVDVGFGINVPFYNNYQLITKYESFPTNTQDNEPQFVKNYFNFPLKTGIALNKKLEIYISYIPAADILYVKSTLNFQSNISSYQAGLNYFFGND